MASQLRRRTGLLYKRRSARSRPSLVRLPIRPKDGMVIRFSCGLIAFAFVSVLVPADLMAQDAGASASRKPGGTVRARKCPDGRLLTLDTSCYDPSAVPPPRRPKKAKRSPPFLPVETVTPKPADCLLYTSDAADE